MQFTTSIKRNDSRFFFCLDRRETSLLWRAGTYVTSTTTSPSDISRSICYLSRNGKRAPYSTAVPRRAVTYVRWPLISPRKGKERTKARGCTARTEYTYTIPVSLSPIACCTGAAARKDRGRLAGWLAGWTDGLDDRGSTNEKMGGGS